MRRMSRSQFLALAPAIILGATGFGKVSKAVTVNLDEDKAENAHQDDIPEGIEIVENLLFYYPDSEYGIYALVIKNTSDLAAKQVQCSAVPWDSKGNIMGGAYYDPFMNNLRPGETTALIGGIWQCEEKPTSINFMAKVTEWIPVDEANDYKPEILATGIHHSPEDSTQVVLQVKNTDEREYSSIQACVILRDREGKAVGAAQGSEMGIKANSSAVITTSQDWPREALDPASIDVYFSLQDDSGITFSFEPTATQSESQINDSKS